MMQLKNFEGSAPDHALASTGGVSNEGGDIAAMLACTGGVVVICRGRRCGDACLYQRHHD